MRISARKSKRVELLSEASTEPKSRGPTKVRSTSPRQNTKIESEGAEFLVLGQMMIEGILAYKAYTNTSGYDLVAVCPESNRSARIQVKSRWATDAGAHPIKKFDCEFVVLVRLNRGNRYRKKKQLDGKAAPEFFVLPVKEAKNRTITSGWTKLQFRRKELEPFQDRWALISEFLSKPKRTRSWRAGRIAMSDHA